LLTPGIAGLASATRSSATITATTFATSHAGSPGSSPGPSPAFNLFARVVVDEGHHCAQRSPPSRPKHLHADPAIEGSASEGSVNPRLLLKKPTNCQPLEETVPGSPGVRVPAIDSDTFPPAEHAVPIYGQISRSSGRHAQPGTWIAGGGVAASSRSRESFILLGSSQIKCLPKPGRLIPVYCCCRFSSDWQEECITRQSASSNGDTSK
jgi:hypothetical protein